jgi:hypothetical protein
MYGTLSPLMLIAGQGLMQNTGLGINTTLSSRIGTYTSFNVVSEYAAAISVAEANEETIDPITSISDQGVPTASINQIKSYTASIFPAVNNTIPSIVSIGSTTNRFTAQLTAHANNILGNGDLSKFVVQMYTVMAYTVSSGSFIDAAVSTDSSLGPTFSNMDELTTGSISSISLATVEFGTDLVNTGLLIDLDKLNTYGTPHALIVKLATRGLLSYISEELIKAGVNPTALSTKITGLADNETLPLIIQKKCYEAFKTITGNKLTTIKAALRVNIPTGIDTLADLIDTQKIFPLSYRTLTSPYKTGYKAIYVNNNAVNGLFKNLGKDYYSILTTGLADANTAMRRALQQIKNIQNLRTDQLGAAVKLIQTNYGLNLINSLDKPLPTSVYSYYTTSFGGGSGSNGRYYLSDGIGTPAGITHNDAFASMNATLTALISNGALNGLYDGTSNGAFTVLKDALNGVYGIPYIDPSDPLMSTDLIIPPGKVGAGTYTTWASAISAILSGTTTVINNILSAYPAETASANAQIVLAAQQIEKELDTLSDSGVVFADTPSSKQSIQNMVQNLHTYAIQNEYRGPAELLEKMADQTTQAGQALVGALREGRNISALNTIGVGMDNVPATPTDPADGTGEFEEAIYSVDEAIANISTD